MMETPQPISPHFDFGTPPPTPPSPAPAPTTKSKSRCSSKSKSTTTPTSLTPSSSSGSGSQSDKYSTSKPWYHTTIGKRLGPEARELLENYSHIPKDEVDAHVYKMRDFLWFQTPYPSIGNFSFLTLRLLTHPLYPRIINTLSAPSSPSNPPALFLDLGCCVAQELRSLAHHASIPPAQLYGTDYNASFLKSSFKVFNDHDAGYTLLPANILDPNFFDLTFRNLIQKFTIIHAALFMHLFTWDQQLQVCENVVRLMQNQEGALFVGCMAGKVGGGEGEQGRWLHDADSWVRLWGEVWERLGMEGSWKVQGELRELRELGELARVGERDFEGGGMGLFEFSVERTGGSREGLAWMGMGMRIGMGIDMRR
ncbi:hypothetical protein EYC80_000804 [Monilinia laxa]|uniref:Methyltransferase domain-containing protein n=1 Tax=Monilinia laxa TaxID=61186 RepID=A0A5N6K775_MONLA|nr:hypothetical protein EYC80_000804 [Monilinia laxa]